MYICILSICPLAEGRSRICASIVCIVYTHWSKKWVFRPAGATRCPDKREIWHGERTPVPNFTFIGAEMWENSPQNCQHFEFWARCMARVWPFVSIYYCRLVAAVSRLVVHSCYSAT